MKRGFEHLHFEENQTGEALLSELETSDSPLQALGKIHGLCCVNPGLYANELLHTNRERFVKDLKHIVLADTKKQEKGNPSRMELEKCVDMVKDILVRTSAVPLPGDASLDFGDFVGFIFDRTPKDNPDRLNEIIALIASTLYSFEMIRHKLKFGKALMRHLVERIDGDEDGEAKLQVIRYITTGCPENVKSFIALGGEQSLDQILSYANKTPNACSFACGIIANVCSVNSSLLKQSSDFLFSVDDFVCRYCNDAKVCCMGLVALFALVRNNPENLTILYWIEWEYKARFLRRMHTGNDVIYTLCSGIITMFEQLSMFWNIHTERGERTEIIKSIFVVLKGSPSKDLAKNGMRILKDIVIAEPITFRCMVVKGVESLFDKYKKDKECKEYIKQIDSFLRNKRELDLALGVDHRDD